MHESPTEEKIAKAISNSHVVLGPPSARHTVGVKVNVLCDNLVSITLRGDAREVERMDSFMRSCRYRLVSVVAVRSDEVLHPGLWGKNVREFWWSKEEGI